MTEVAYDIVKTFRNSKEAFRNAKFESYIHWLIRRASKKSLFLNFFRSSIKSLFFFSTGTSNNYSTCHKNWLNIYKYRINKSQEILSYTKKNSSSKFSDNNSVLPYNIQLYSTTVLGNLGVKKRLNKKLSKFDSTWEYWYKGIYPDINTFRFKQFNTGKAMVEAFEILSIEDKNMRKSGRSNIYNYITYSSGLVAGRTSKYLISNGLKIRYRLIFRSYIIKMLLNVLCGKISVSTIYVLIKSVSYKNYSENRTLFNIIINLLNRYSKSRLLYVIKLLRSYNRYDNSYLWASSKYSITSSVSRYYITKQRHLFVKSYQKFFVSSTIRSWFPIWSYPNSVKGNSDMVRHIESSYRCELALARMEDHHLDYNTGLYNRCYFQMSRLNTMRSIFTKWYYLFLVKDKNMLHYVGNFYKQEYLRRLLIRNLYLFAGSGSYSDYNFISLFNFFYEGALCPTKNILGSITTSKIHNNCSIKAYKNKYSSILHTKRLSLDIEINYISYTQKKLYFMNMINYAVIFKLKYFKYFFAYNELRNKFIYASTLLNINFRHLDDILLYSDFYFSKYHIQIYNKGMFTVAGGSVLSISSTRCAASTNYIKIFNYCGNFENAVRLYYDYAYYFSYFSAVYNSKNLYSALAVSCLYKLNKFISFSYPVVGDMYSTSLQFSGKIHTNFFNSIYGYRTNSNCLSYVLCYMFGIGFTSIFSDSKFLSFEDYLFIDKKRDRKHLRGDRGSYMTRPMYGWKKFIVQLPNINMTHYVYMNMIFHIFLFQLQDKSNHSNTMLSWSYLVSKLSLKIKYICKCINKFEVDVKKLKNFSDDTSLYTFTFYKLLGSHFSNWQSLRKVTSYVKYQEYFFLLSSISSLVGFRSYFGSTCSIKHGGINIDKNVNAKFLLLNSFVSFGGINHSLVLLKKLFFNNFNFGGYSDHDSLVYWSEVGHDICTPLDHIGNICTYSYLMSGMLVHSNKYLKDVENYYKLYYIGNPEYEDVMLGTYHRDISKFMHRSNVYIRENIKKAVRLDISISGNFRDGRAFFNPTLNNMILAKEDNFIISKIWGIYTKVKYGTRSVEEYTTVDILYNALAGRYPTNIYSWENTSSTYGNYASFFATCTNSTLCALSWEKYKNNTYEILISEISENFGLGYNDFSIDRNGYMYHIYSKYSYGELYYQLRSQFIRNLNLSVKFNVVSSFICNSKEISIGSSYGSEFLLNNKLTDSYAISSNLWYITVFKSLMISSYKSYLKVNVVWSYMFLMYKNVRLGVDFYQYGWIMRNYYLSIFCSQIGNTLLVHTAFNTYMKYIKFHIGRLFLINRWIYYWAKFLSPSFKMYSSAVSYKLLSKYINSVYLVNFSDSVQHFHNTYLSANNRYSMYTLLVTAEFKSRIVNYAYTSDMFGMYSYVVSNIYKNFIMLKNITAGGAKLCLVGKLAILVSYYYTDRLHYWFNIYRNVLCCSVYKSLHHYTGKAEWYNISDSIVNMMYYTYSIIKFLSNYSIVTNLVPVNSMEVIVKHAKKKLYIYTRSFIMRRKYLLHSICRYYIPYLGHNITSAFSFNTQSLTFYCALGLFAGVRYYMGICNFLNYASTSLHVHSVLGNEVTGVYISDSHVSIHSEEFTQEIFTMWDYLSMFEYEVKGAAIDNLQTWFTDHYSVRFDTRRYYSKFWYRYLPEDIIHIQRYRRFQQELRRLIANRKKLRSGIIYRRLLLFKLVPGISKEWHRLHVRRPYIREQFEDRVRFFYIFKYKYHISRKRFLSSLHNRFISPSTLYRSYHLIYFRLDNILFKLNFIPSFTYLKVQWATKFWNISVNNICNRSRIQHTLIIGDMFYILSGVHNVAVNYRLSFHFNNNFYLVYLLWYRLNSRDRLPIYVCLPTDKLHIDIGRLYLWYWYRYFFSKSNVSGLYLYLCNSKFFEIKMLYYGFWAHNFLCYKDFKNYMLISKLDYSIRWFSRSMCGFVYKEPVGFIPGLHYTIFNNKESGSYGGHLKFNSAYK